MTEEKLIKIEVAIPKQIHEFLRALTIFSDVDVEEYVREAIISSVQADILSIDSPLFDAETIKIKYGL